MRNCSSKSQTRLHDEFVCNCPVCFSRRVCRWKDEDDLMASSLSCNQCTINMNMVSRERQNTTSGLGGVQGVIQLKAFVVDHGLKVMLCYVMHIHNYSY